MHFNQKIIASGILQNNNRAEMLFDPYIGQSRWIFEQYYTSEGDRVEKEVLLGERAERVAQK